MILLALLFVCHFLADYTHLSQDWMLAAKRFGKPLSPIFCHATMHGALMFLVLDFFVEPNLAGSLTLLQIGSHFAIDIWKGRMNVWFPPLANPANKLHWYIFGFDQLLHALVIILMVKLAT